MFMRSPIMVSSFVWLALICGLHQVTQVGSRKAEINQERVSDGPLAPLKCGDRIDENLYHPGAENKPKSRKKSMDEQKREFLEMAEKTDANHDKILDRQELIKLFLMSFEAMIREEILKEFSVIDTNNDGKISLAEHFASDFGGCEPKREFDEKDFPLILDEERELFNLADVDEDSFLSRDEYPAFALPHEYPRMHQLLINQTMRRKDKNKDGKLSLDEYLSDNEIRGLSMLDEATEKKRFEENYDLNHDGFLDMEELKRWVIPDLDSFANEKVDEMLARADSNKDGFLSFDEIAQHHHVFNTPYHGEPIQQYRDEL